MRPLFVHLPLLLAACSAGGTPGLEPVPPAVPFSEAARARVAVSVCEGSTFGGPLEVLAVFGGYVPYVGEVRQKLARLLQCVLDASDCADAAKCNGVFVDEPCPKSAALESHCEGPTLLIACYYIGKELPYGGQSYRLRRSCPDTDVDNPLCIDLGSGGAGCGTGTCEPGDEPARFSCEGDSMVICSWGLERRFECGDASMGCEMRMLDSELAPLCVPKCERPRCSGTVMSNCFMRPVDCRWFGKDYTCLPTEDGTGVRCGVPERRCNENEAVCDGDAALLCFGGAWLRFDCSQFLNAKCVKVNETRVRCAMPEPPAPTPS